MSGLSPGFADPALDSQSCFRALLDAMARPGTIRAAGRAEPPAPLGAAMGAALLTLADLDTPVWLDPAFEPARAWLAFHAGAPFADAPPGAALAACAALPDLGALDAGGHETPEASATALVELASLRAGAAFRLSGPGLREPKIVRWDGLPADFAARWRANRALFPRGVDLILCAGGELACLPRGIAVEDA